VSRIRSGGRRRQQVRAGAPDAALTPNAGMAAITELYDRLGVTSALDAAVGPIKQRDRGFGAGELRRCPNAPQRAFQRAPRQVPSEPIWPPEPDLCYSI
jgi:hypothetical protein